MDEITIIKTEDGGIEATKYRHQNEIIELKKKLTETDFEILKFCEDLLTCTSTLELLSLLAKAKREMSIIIANRVGWRMKIKELERINDAE